MSTGTLRYRITVSFWAMHLTIAFKVLQSVVLQAKKLGKSVYLFSIDREQGKVAHVNFVAEDAKAKGVDGRAWANTVVDIVGGKACQISSSSLAYPSIIHWNRLVVRKMVRRVLV